MSNIKQQKQPPEVFCKKRCSQKIPQYLRKTPVLTLLFNKVTCLNFIKKRLQHMCFPVNTVKFFHNTHFVERLSTAAFKAAIGIPTNLSIIVSFYISGNVHTQFVTQSVKMTHPWKRYVWPSISFVARHPT